MNHMGVELANTYDLRLVTLSMAIAVLASYTALDTVGEVKASLGSKRIGWLLGGAVAMGAGIWSMHFIGMLAFCLPISVTYDGLMVLLSMLAAILASGVALFLISRPLISLPWLCSGSVVMGLGISTMHYMGMAAMRTQAIAQYNLWLVTLSVLIGIGLSLLALWLTFQIRCATTKASLQQKIGSALVMGAAVPSMHYTAMASATFIPTDAAATTLLSTLDNSWLAVAISSATLVILGLALLTSVFKQQVAAQVFNSQILQESEKLLDIIEYNLVEADLRKAYEELEGRMQERTVELAKANAALQDQISESLRQTSLRKQAELALTESETRYRELAQCETLLNHLVKQICHSLDLDTILEIVVQEIRNLMQVDQCLFVWHRTEEETDYWDIIKEAKNPEGKSFLCCYPVDRENGLAKKLLNLELLRIDDLDLATEEAKQQFQEKGYAAILSLPLQTRSGRVGIVICGNFSRPRCWRDSEVKLLQAVNAHLEIAISQAELYDKAAHTAAKAVAQATQLSKAMEELQQTQTQLIQTEKMSSLGQMVAGIAHEINNPVNFIYGNLIYAGEYTHDLLHLLNLYQQNYPNPSSQIQDFAEAMDLDFVVADLPKMLTSMETGADRIRQIVLSLRNFSRLDEAQMKSVDIHEGIDSTLMILHHRLKARPDHPAIQVIKEYGNLPEVECYPGQLNQVFMNILANAIDAVEEVKGEKSKDGATHSDEFKTCQHTLNPLPLSLTIIIRTELLESSDRVVIRIRDSGAGIPASLKDHLFDPFFTTKPVGKGTGLGLSISYQIVVEHHGGVLQCFSEPGQGAEFWIEIPIKQSCSNSNFSGQAVNNRQLIA